MKNHPLFHAALVLLSGFGLVLVVAGGVVGCAQNLVFNYKGSVSTNNQESEDGANMNGKPEVPKNEGGSDTLVPILGKIRELMELDAEVAMDALNACRKMADDGNMTCKGLTIPGLPSLDMSEIAKPPAGNTNGAPQQELNWLQRLFQREPPAPAQTTPLEPGGDTNRTEIPAIRGPLPVPSE